MAEPLTLASPLPTRGLDLMALDRAETSVVALVDIDDFVVSSVARGEEWARAEVAAVAAIVDEERPTEPASTSLYRLEPDEWVVIAAGQEPSELRRHMIRFGEHICSRVRRETNSTVTVSVGPPATGPDRVERSLSDAVNLNQRKLIVGGNRVITEAVSALTDDEDAPAPERIEQELSRKLRDGDAQGALTMLKAWIARSAELEGVTPDVLRSWVAAEILFALNVIGERRLSDGSTDWLAIFGQTSFDELLTMGTIHEQSYLVLWLERLFARVLDQTSAPSTSSRHVLKLVETYIQEHYAEDLSLTKVAQAVFVSPFYISHLFHREHGTTFLKYLTAIRVAKARSLLLGTSLQVSEVAALVGYGTPKSFRCAFKRVVGVTPIEFRSQATI
jgi:AraC-like DNA-binding protein/GGDEF domain-containing protein